MGGSRCTFRDCPVLSTRYPGMHFFHYPVRDKNRFQKWMQMAGASEKTYKLSQLKNRVVCGRHFRETCFMNYKKDRLSQLAVPTLMPISKDYAYDYEQLDEIGQPYLIRVEKCTMPHLIPPPGFKCSLYLDELSNEQLDFQTHLDKGEKSTMPQEVPPADFNCSVHFDEVSEDFSFIYENEEPTDSLRSQKRLRDGGGESSRKKSKHSNNTTEHNKEQEQIIEENPEILAQNTNIQNINSDTTFNEEIECIELSDKEDNMTVEFGKFYALDNQEILETSQVKKTTENDQKNAKIEQLNKRILELEEKLQEKDCKLQIAHNKQHLIIETDEINQFKTLKKQKQHLINDLENIQRKYNTLVIKHNELQRAYSEIKSKHSQMQKERNVPPPQEVATSTTIKTEVATVDGGAISMKPQLPTKAQLFNGIKRYLSSSMTSLLRMEMYGSSERQWKPDERRTAVDLMRLGRNIYTYFIQEWRLRLPSERLTETWLEEFETLDEDEDI